jgi:hypothetical protein
VLEAVGIEVARVERGVRLHVVVELDDLDVEAFALRHFLDDRPNLRIGPADGADLDDAFVGACAEAGGECGCRNGGGKELEEISALHGKVRLT